MYVSVQFYLKARKGLEEIKRRVWSDLSDPTFNQSMSKSSKSLTNLTRNEHGKSQGIKKAYDWFPSPTISPHWFDLILLSVEVE